MKTCTFFILLFTVFMSCRHSLPVGEPVDVLPDIFPDYTEVTVPHNIAPLNFALKNSSADFYAVFVTKGQELTVKARKGELAIPASHWKDLLKAATGHSVTVTVYAKERMWIRYRPFKIYVASEPVDPYIAYRLIEPGYALWNQMGIYQRNVETFTESAIMENRLTGGNCMNCHSFCMQNPEKMLFHMRDLHAGTLLVDGETIEKLNTKTEQTISPLAYPSWHPSGNYVAFSVNTTRQSYHMNHPNRIEVYDEASDVAVYDIKRHEIITSTLLSAGDVFETFPTFSPDGTTLYFCSAQSRPMPHAYEDVKYSLCAISFDPENRCFGATVDTLYHADSAGKSVAFPRVSPDGKYLMYTLSGYGNFSIWHNDADLYLVDLSTGKHTPLDTLNSVFAESYHSWSSNSRWVVFSSRRMDGLYTHPYIAYINTKGKASKPFLLPQKDTKYYHRFLKSYNIPEFVTGKVKDRKREFARKSKKESGMTVKFVSASSTRSLER